MDTSNKPSTGAVKKVASKKLTIRHTLTSKLRMVKANPFLDLKSVDDVDPGPSRRCTIQPGALPLQRKLFQQEPKKALSELRKVETKAPVEAKRAMPIKRLFTALSDKAGSSIKAPTLLRATKSQPNLRKPAAAPTENQPKQSARARALSYCPRPSVVKKAALPKTAIANKEKPATANKEKPSTANKEKPSTANKEKPSTANKEKPATADKEKPAPLKPVSSRTATPRRPTKAMKENQPATSSTLVPAKAAKENQPTTPAKRTKEYRPPTPGVRLVSHSRSRSVSALEVSKSVRLGEDPDKSKPGSHPSKNCGQTPSKSLLRSASAHNIQKAVTPGKRRDVKTQKENQPITPILKSLRKSQSARDIRKSNAENDNGSADETKLYGTIATPRKTVTFFSPVGRCSASSAMAELNSLKTPPPSVLRERLNKWLAKRGKLSYTFSHLRCFGLQGQNVTPKTSEPAKATPNLNETFDSSTKMELTAEASQDVAARLEDLEDTPHLPLAASSPDDRNKENFNNEEFSGPEVLVELRSLIFCGYARDQCEQWLRALTKVRPSLDDLPEYWECLAALEEARGDFNSAVDCYGRAIVKGADEDKVGDSLDRLWEKFSQLSSSPCLRNRTPSRRALIDPKQIFKSSVIKFALQNKAVKKFSADTGVTIPTYVCTPVRRSTRRSTSSFKSTPTVKCVSSLNELEQDERENMEFHSNTILNPNVQ